MKFMRNLFYLFVLLAFVAPAIADRTGTILSAPVTVGSPANTFPSAYNDEIHGSHKTVADLTARDAIFAERREIGMTCYVISEEKTYRLEEGITNSDWEEVISSGGATALDGLTDAAVSGASSTQILIHDGVADFRNRTLSGDVAFGTTGISAIQANAVGAGNINWPALTQEVQTGNVNWTSIVNQEVQNTGVNWTSLNADITETAFNFTDLTTGNASSSAHGLMKKLSGVATEYYGGDGNFTTPAGSATTLDGLTDAAVSSASSAQMLIHDGVSNFRNRTLSGDVSLGTTGIVAMTANSVALGTDTTGNYAGSSSEGGAATTATALAANGANCPAGEFPLGVNASGAAENCTEVAATSGGWTDLGTAITNTTLTDNVAIGSTVANQKLTVDGNFNLTGNLGIGSTNPAAELDLGPSGAALIPGGITIGTGSAIPWDFASAEGMRFDPTANDFGTAEFVISNTGNVGINSLVPTQKLDVGGTVNATAFVGDGSGLTNIAGGASGWTDGGTSIYTTTATDNVGLGTTIPRNFLHLHIAGTDGEPRIQFTNDATTAADDDQGTLFGLSDDESFLINNQENTSMAFRTNNIARLSIMADGNVGINTTAPLSKLSIVGAGATNATNALNIRDSAQTSRFVVQDGGNVGIGSSSPSATLDVGAGTCKIGAITTSGTFTSTGSLITMSNATNPGMTLSDTSGPTTGNWNCNNTDCQFGTTTSHPMVFEYGNAAYLTLASGAATFATTVISSSTGSLGWSVVVGDDVACTTTCTTAAMGGQDTDAAPYPIVGPSDATADRCFCAGAN